MIKKVAYLYLAIFSPVILITFFFSHPVAQVIFAVLAVAFPSALIALGAAKQGRLGPIATPLLVLFLLHEGCVVGMLLSKGHVLDGPWIGGLPLGAAIQIYAAWLVPLVLVSLAYGLTFERFSLKEEDLAKLSRFEKRPRSHGEQ